MELYHSTKMWTFFGGVVRELKGNYVLNLVALTSNFLELREFLHLNHLASAKWGVLMKLVEILALND